MLPSVLYLVPAIAGLAGAACHQPTVSVRSGVIVGTTTSLPAATATVNKFLGIPYAKSPPERFAPPSAASRWTALRNATTFGDACLQQNNSLSPFGYAEPSQSENCLYLNVFQPGGSSPDGGWPVMVWIHGGGLQFGSGDVPEYDGSSFAAYEDVVFISFNYRLSVFGFPGAPNMPNFGFLDQRFALSWVQENIRAFQGDPERVTLFGESSGAVSVDSILTLPPAEIPFRAAIIQSGSVLGNALSNLGIDPNTTWDRLVTAFDCSSAINATECLRAVPALQLQAFANNASLPAVVLSDNITYTPHSGQQRASGRAANVPVMVGSTANDGTIFTLGQTNLSAFITSTFSILPGLESEVEKAYAVGTAGISTEGEAIAQIFTEVGLQCPAALLAQQVEQADGLAWRYIYNATFPNLTPAPGLGAYHSSELPLVFSTYNMTTATAQEYALSNYMRGAWARFARDPVAGPGWGTVGSFNATDLGLLGVSGTSGVTVVSPLVTGIDKRCALYETVYSLLA